MKKVILGLAIILSIASCKKESAKVCNCGLVLSDDVTDYSVIIRNSCSGNERKFVLQPGDWINAQVGSDYCITNIVSW
jgi:hypothetical protein